MSESENWRKEKNVGLLRHFPKGLYLSVFCYQSPSIYTMVVLSGGLSVLLRFLSVRYGVLCYDLPCVIPIQLIVWWDFFGWARKINYVVT